MIFKSEYNKTWLLVFYHNSITSEWFTEENQIRNINTSNRFSILGLLDESYQVNGFFEFLLEYPLIGGSNQWLQRVSPLSTISESDNVDYFPIRIDHTLSWGDGLKRSSQSTYTFLDASRSSYWFSVGAKKGYNVAGKFPGFNLGNDSPTSECKLWIRMTSKATQPTCFQINPFLHSVTRYYIFVLFSFSFM